MNINYIVQSNSIRVALGYYLFVIQVSGCGETSAISWRLRPHQAVCTFTGRQRRPTPAGLSRDTVNWCTLSVYH